MVAAKFGSQSNISEEDDDYVILSEDFVRVCNKDLAKKSMVPVKYFLECLTFWPNKPGIFTLILNYLSIISMAIMLYGGISYMIQEVDSVPKLADVATLTSTVISGLVRVTICIIMRQKTNVILNIFWKQFWPAYLADNILKQTIIMKLKIIEYYALSFLMLATTGCTQFMITPLIIGNGKLPVASKFPFDYNGAPLYELMTVWLFFNNYFIVFVYIGFDYFFLCYLTNVVVQLKILQLVLRNTYTDDDDALKRVINDHFQLSRGSKGNDFMLLLNCVRHHQLLMMVCDKMETIYSAGIFSQFALAIISICVSTTCLTIDRSQMFALCTYLVAHTWQLFMYCYMGNELIYESQNVANAAFECGWHLNFNEELIYSLRMVIMRAEKQQFLTALGFTEMSYRSFVNVLRLSFSCFTLLQYFINKKEFQ